MTSVIPAGGVNVSDGSGEMIGGWFGCWFRRALGGVCVSSACARWAPARFRTCSVPSRADPSSEASTRTRYGWPGLTSTTNRSSSPAGSIRPLKTAGAGAFVGGAAGSAASRTSGRSETARGERTSSSSVGSPPRPIACVPTWSRKLAAGAGALTVAAATRISGRVPPRSSKPTVSPRRPPSG